MSTVVSPPYQTAQFGKIAAKIAAVLWLNASSVATDGELLPLIWFCCAVGLEEVVGPKADLEWRYSAARPLGEEVIDEGWVNRACGFDTWKTAVWIPPSMNDQSGFLLIGDTIFPKLEPPSFSLAYMNHFCNCHL